MAVLSTACDVIVRIEGHEGESFPLPLFTEHGEKKSFKVVQHEIERDILCDGSRAKLFLEGPHGGLMESTWPRVHPGSVLWVRREFHLTSPALSRSPSFADLRGKGVMAAMSSVGESGGHLEASIGLSRAHAHLEAANFSSALPVSLPSSARRSTALPASLPISPPGTRDNSPDTSRRSSLINPSADPSSQPTFPSSQNGRTLASTARARSQQRLHAVGTLVDALLASLPSPPAAPEQDEENPFDSPSLDLLEYERRRTDGPLTPELVDRRNGVRRAQTSANLGRTYVTTSPSNSRAPSPARPALSSRPSTSRLLSHNEPTRPISPHHSSSRQVASTVTATVPPLRSRSTVVGPVSRPAHSKKTGTLPPPKSPASASPPVSPSPRTQPTTAPWIPYRP
ncbi:hypothetical protein JCM8547_008573 [Rhodosporidiobolus lusitaniae]